MSSPHAQSESYADPLDRVFRYVADASTLDDLTEQLRSVDRVAFDTEADSFYHYHEKVCLIQLSFNNKYYLIDPLSGIDLAGLLEILADKTLIIHDAGYDLRILHRQYGFIPRRGIFDTMPAAQLAGFTRFGLADLLEQLLKVILPKKGQRSDWSRRPLETFQMQYAVADTAHLTNLADLLRLRLEQLGRLDWHCQTCQHVIHSAINHKTAVRRDAWRIPGSNRLSPRELAFVRTIWHWREKQARTSDLPPFKILGNEPLMKLAVLSAKRPDTPVEKLLHLPRHCVNHRLSLLQEAVNQAAALPQSEWPSPFRQEFAPQPAYSTELFEALRREVATIAEKLGLAPSLLAPRATMIMLVVKKPKTIDEMVNIAPLLRWQAELIFPAMKKIAPAT